MFPRCTFKFPFECSNKPVLGPLGCRDVAIAIFGRTSLSLALARFRSPSLARSLAPSFALSLARPLVCSPPRSPLASSLARPLAPSLASLDRSPLARLSIARSPFDRSLAPSLACSLARSRRGPGGRLASKVQRGLGAATLPSEGSGGQRSLGSLIIPSTVFTAVKIPSVSTKGNSWVLTSCPLQGLPDK